MARRFSAPYLKEPVSGLATWARNLAVFSAVATLVSIGVVRFGFLEMRPAMATWFGALALAGVSILLALAGFKAVAGQARCIVRGQCAGYTWRTGTVLAGQRQDVRQLRGYLKGIKTDFVREGDRA